MRNILLAATAGAIVIAAPLAISQSSFSKVTTIGQTNALTIDQNRGVLTMAPLIDRISPAVVSIATEGRRVSEDLSPEQEELFERFFGRRAPQQRRRGGAGSGVIVDAGAGYILTNHHVVDDAEEIRVTLLDRREFDAELVGGDEKTDIAVLKINADDLTDISFAQEDSTRVGDYVIAIGNPFGLGHTVTTGIVSALGRDLRSGENYQDFIQTDASINPGNSGGALVNSKGQLIGINSAIISRSGGNNGIGFAVPVKMAKGVMDQLVSFGEVRRGRIGVTIKDITPDEQVAFDLPTLEGAWVNNVLADSPADKAGLEAGDIIVSFNGEDILDASDIRNAVGLVQPGTRTDLTYIRDGRRRTTRILIEADKDEKEILSADASDDNPAMESFSGASITNIPDDLNLRGGDEGVYVAEVERGSRAFRSGLREGDIIRKVSRQNVSDLGDFEDAIQDKDGPIALTIERDGSNLFLAVR